MENTVWNALLSKYYSDDQVKNGMSGRVACRETGEVHTEFLWRILRERDHLEDLGLNVTIILK